ncbi:MAG: trypsin-like peptidase domain-containing protein, partial [Burkholderiales bacterium]|nr:trypsin-like peptidase domain-containing protein [Phycisphaerae bacterium]
MTSSWRTLLVAAALGLAVGYVLFASAQGPRAEPRLVTTRPDLPSDERETISLFRAVSPSVVFITTKQQQVDIFGREMGEVDVGSGSGFVWDDTGHIVTNFHVIRGASAATLSFGDDQTYRAELVGTAPEHDIAVLRIKP